MDDELEQLLRQIEENIAVQELDISCLPIEDEKLIACNCYVCQSQNYE